MRKSVALIGYPCGIVRPATVTLSAASMWSSYLMNACATPISSTTPTCRVSFRWTVTLKQVSVGTELNIVQEGLPDVIPQEACYLGWQESLRNLAKLVEPEINQ